MRIASYFWRLIRWTLFLQASLVALVPITKNSVGNVALDNISNSDPEDDKELKLVRGKRQIVDPDDELNPKPSDLTKENVNIQSQEFFHPISNNENDETKSESSISNKNILFDHLDRLKKPSYENVQVPLYDDDIENNPDPLRGILDPNYWEEGNPFSKVFNFFGKTLMSSKPDSKRKGDVDNNFKTKLADGNNAVGKENKDENIHEGKVSCSSNTYVPNHFINKLPKSDDKHQTDEKHWFQTNNYTKSQDEQKEKLERNAEKSLTDKEAKVLPKDFTIVLGTNKVKSDNENKDYEYSQIPKDMANNLEHVIHKIVNKAVTGVLEQRVDDGQDFKTKNIDDVNKLINVGDYGSLEEEMDDNNKFSSLSNIRRHLLSFNEEDEQHSLDKPNLNGGNGYGRENYFAIDSNMDSMNRELKYKQNYLDFFKNTARGVTKPSNNVFQEKLPIENVINGLVDNFNLSRNKDSKSNVANSPVGFNIKKGRRRQVGTHTPSEAMIRIQPGSNLLDTDEKLKSNILLTDTIGIADKANQEPRVESSNPLKHTKSDSSIAQEKLSIENVMGGMVGNVNLNEMQNSNRNIFKHPVGFNLRRGHRRQVNSQTPSEGTVFIQPESNLLNTDDRLKSKVVLKDITNGIDGIATTNQDPMASSTPITSTSATTSVSSVSSASVTAVSRQRNVTDIIGNETTTESMSATDTPVDDEDEQMNIDVSNKVVDAIFAQANAHGSMRNTLGICRKSGDLKTVKGSKVAENKLGSVVEDVMKCVNTILKSHAEKQMCLMLDDSLHEFLRWLLLSGEAMHGKDFVAEKPEFDKSEFLFPSMCSDTSTEQTKKPEVLQVKY